MTKVQTIFNIRVVERGQFFLRDRVQMPIPTFLYEADDGPLFLVQDQVHYEAIGLQRSKGMGEDSHISP